MAELSRLLAEELRNSELELQSLDLALQESRRNPPSAAVLGRLSEAEATIEELEKVIVQLDASLKMHKGAADEAEARAARTGSELERTRRQLEALSLALPGPAEGTTEALEARLAEANEALSRAQAAAQQASDRTESALSEAEARYAADLSAAGERRLRVERQLCQATARAERAETQLQVVSSAAASLAVELEVAGAKIAELEALCDAKRRGRKAGAAAPKRGPRRSAVPRRPARPQSPTVAAPYGGIVGLQ